jgi:hypothetical protein
MGRCVAGLPPGGQRIEEIVDGEEGILARCGRRGWRRGHRRHSGAATAAGDTAAAKLFTDKATLRSQVLGPLQAVEADVDAVIKAQCG